MGFVFVMRAVAIGAAATLALRYGIGMPLGALVRALAIDYSFARMLMATWMPPLITALVWTASGWIVARFNRAHSMGAVTAYAIFINLWSLPRTYTAVANALDDVRFVPGLIAHGTGIVAATIGVFAGGWLADLGRSRTPARVTGGRLSEDA